MEFWNFGRESAHLDLELVIHLDLLEFALELLLDRLALLLELLIPAIVCRFSIEYRASGAPESHLLVLYE